MSPLKLVIVDDDDAVRSVIADVAHETLPTAQITEHASARYALHDVETGSVDLLITNCHMPDMDGPTLVKTLREHKHSLPIIMVSGSEDAQELGKRAGIDRFVEKSLLHPMLEDAIFALLAPEPARPAFPP